MAIRFAQVHITHVLFLLAALIIQRVGCVFTHHCSLCLSPRVESCQQVHRMAIVTTASGSCDCWSYNQNPFPGTYMTLHARCLNPGVNPTTTPTLSTAQVPSVTTVAVAPAVTTPVIVTTTAATTPATFATTAPPPGVALVYDVVDRINAGGPDVTDSVGNVWRSDSAMNPGGSTIQPSAFIGPVVYNFASDNLETAQCVNPPSPFANSDDVVVNVAHSPTPHPSHT
jgi:hypothetical protein